MLSIKPEIEITQEEFEKFRDYFYRKTGIHFESSKRYFVDKRLKERIELTENDSFRHYFTYLRYESANQEFQALVNLLTVNETYFYREDYQFECLVNSILPEIIARKKRNDSIRIWSIPCATGEEPYSLAIYLLENWPLVNQYEIEIVASDIDTQVLNVARQGIYGIRSLQRLPPALLKKYFKVEGLGQYQICEALRQSIDFHQMNLNDVRQTGQYRGFDVIFCRNLLIYFDDFSRRQAANTFYDALHPSGFLCLGHSESMSRISSIFKVRKYPDAIVYQKGK